MEIKEQGNIHLKILPYLKDIKNGFFVEAGALDGLFMSNTKALEDMGWNGLLIEPSAQAVEKCKQNRKCLVEECALVSKDYVGDTVTGDFFFDGRDGGLGAWSSITRRHYDVYDSNRNLVDKIVYAHTLENIFKKHGIKKVDFLSLDVEGYELEALKGINFDDVDITYILTEINLDEYSLRDVNALLKDYENLGCLSGFNYKTPNWNGLHNDYLYKKK